MSCFKNAKIYIIKFYDKLDNHIYIGSTIKTLKSRFSNHKNNNTSISKYIINNYDNNWNCCYIELYLNYPCSSNKELLKKEYQIINQFAINEYYNVLNIKGNKYK